MHEVCFAHVGVGEIGAAFGFGIKKLAVREKRGAKIRAAKVGPRQPTSLEFRAAEFGLLEVVVAEVAVGERLRPGLFGFVAQATVPRIRWVV
jgi:hypothetical protein